MVLIHINLINYIGFVFHFHCISLRRFFLLAQFAKIEINKSKFVLINTVVDFQCKTSLSSDEP